MLQAVAWTAYVAVVLTLFLRPVKTAKPAVARPSSLATSHSGESA